MYRKNKSSYSHPDVEHVFPCKRKMYETSDFIYKMTKEKPQMYISVEQNKGKSSLLFTVTYSLCTDILNITFTPPTQYRH